MTRKKLTDEGLSSYILSSNRGSASNLDFHQSESMDYVLMLGPFYHMTDSCHVIKLLKKHTASLKKEDYYLQQVLIVW